MPARWEPVLRTPAGWKLSLFPKQRLDFLVSVFCLSDLLRPTGKLLLVAVSRTAMGLGMWLRELFFNGLDQAPGICFLFEMCSGRMRPTSIVCLARGVQKAPLIRGMSFPNLSPSAVFQNSPSLAFRISHTRADTLTRLYLCLFLPTTAAPLVFFYLFADSSFGGRRLNQLIEDLQNHRAVIKGWRN